MPLPDFEDRLADMHRLFDGRMGDVVEMKIPPSDEFVEHKAIVVFDHPRWDHNSALDPLNQTRRLKVRKEILPEPDRDARFRIRKLGPTIFQISGDPEADGSYWLFDIQKADD